MRRRLTGWIDRIMHRRALRRWALVGEGVPAMASAEAQRHRGRAAALRHHLDRVIHEADRRLARPSAGDDPLPRPVGADWVWRPAPWAGPLSMPGKAAAPSRMELALGVTLFHDSRAQEVTLRQVRALSAEDPAPHALSLDTLAFDGSFLSLAIDLPAAVLQGLRDRHLIRLSAVITAERPVEAFARLNVRHGPNLEQIVRDLPQGATTVEFDISGAKVDARRVDKLWLDLIFEAPAMNRIAIAEVTLCRRPRAGL